MFRDIDKGIGYALLAALLFGVSTPMAKPLTAQVSPRLLAGLFSGGSALGLTLWLALRWVWSRDDKRAAAKLRTADLPLLVGAAFFGSVLGPVLLMSGLSSTPAAVTSLLLNLEGVFTALMAWFVFKENFDHRVAVGMALIMLGGALLALNGSLRAGVSWGIPMVVGACACWALDNNLMRALSAGDPIKIAAFKGSVAACVNIGLARHAGEDWPAAELIARAGLTGLFGYGVSVVLFMHALRSLGAARTSAYFSIAPFVGASLAFLLHKETPGACFGLAAFSMGLGVWLHLTERHEHEHTHEPMRHAHSHVHDLHHRHTHDFAWDGTEPHTHEHEHEPLTHTHPHYPDIHHRHKH
jgi:drug/metabolite transporter (DMT)-like permease